MRNSAARIEATRLFLIIVATGSVLPFLILALVYVDRSVAGRLRRLAVAMSALANGDTRIEVPTAGAHDEIGEMAEALQFFKRQTIGAQQLAQEVTDSIRQVAVAAGQATSAIGQVSGGANTQLTALRHVANGLQQSTQAISLVASDAVSAVVKLPFHVAPYGGVLGTTAPQAVAVTTSAATSGILSSVITNQAEPVSP